MFMIILMAISTLLHAQTDVPVSTKGKDFYLSFGNNYGKPSNLSSLQFQIKIVATKATTVRFFYKNNTSLNSTSIYPIPSAPGGSLVRTIKLTTGDQKAAIYSMDTPNDETPVGTKSLTSSKSLRIQSDDSIAVYVLNIYPQTADATNVLPTHLLGTNYYHASYKPADATHSDGYTVVATEDNTIVYENGVQKATLNEGQVYANYTQNTDMTGKHITSTKPIAYFVTNTGVHVPVGVSTSNGTADCLFQQIPPVDMWGSRYLVPVTTQGKERVRVIATSANTHITYTGGGALTSGSSPLNAGQFMELEITTASTVNGEYITSDKPVGVFSYLEGNRNLTPATTNGDPSISWIAPFDQASDRVTIAPFATADNNFTNNYAIVITPTATKAQTTVFKNAATTGASLSGGTTWKDNLNSGFSYYIMELTGATASDYWTFANDAGLFVQSYGIGPQISYYYLGGSALYNLNTAFFVNDIHYQKIAGESFCPDVAIRAELKNLDNTNSGYLKWYIDGVEETSARDQLVWNKNNLTPGSHTIRMDVTNAAGTIQSVQTTITVIQCSSGGDAPKLFPINPGIFFMK
jgi:hypothetical protein